MRAVAGADDIHIGIGAAGQERFGPLAVERFVKDDGRALIIYSHAK